MYVLILTLSWHIVAGSSAATMEHIPGFTTNATCLNAGNAWIKHMNTSRAKAICVKAN